MTAANCPTCRRTLVLADDETGAGVGTCVYCGDLFCAECSPSTCDHGAECCPDCDCSLCALERAEDESGDRAVRYLREVRGW